MDLFILNLGRGDPEQFAAVVCHALTGKGVVIL